MKTPDEINGEILWFEALLDSIEDGDIESAKKVIKLSLIHIWRCRR